MEKNQVAWHLFSEKDLLDKLETGQEGLSEEEVKKRVAVFGKNLLPKKKRISFFHIVLNQFLSPLIYILFVAAIISLIVREYTDAGFIFLVLFINGAMGTYQEWKAETRANALQEMIRIKTRVKREGDEFVLDSENMVPGDIVLLESGNKVPADIRIFRSNNLAAEEALLTGESVAVSKNAASLEKEDLSVSEKINMAFAGTTITSGRATGVVVATGLNTEIGKIASSLRELKVGKAPLVTRMEVFAKKISIIVLTGCFFLGILGYINGVPLIEIFMFVVAVAVSAIPEGLPIAMTVALSIGTVRMARRNVIVRKLTAVEGLGSCTFIATDKTGTLTVDQQTVKSVLLADGREFFVDGEGYNGTGAIHDAGKNRVKKDDNNKLDELIKAVTICNEGSLRKAGQEWKNAGDPVDIALLALSYKAQASPQEYLRNVEKIKEVPYESEKQYSAVYYREGEALKIVVKGALEKIIEKIHNPDPAILDTVAKLAESGFRIIAVAGNVVSDTDKNELPELILLGVTALIDPLRPEARDAIVSCHDAGVEVAMITGDHPSTALAIANNLGLAGDKEELISGSQLKEAYEKGEHYFAELIKGKRVFARVSPDQKQQIVQALRTTGHFVAVTGDGVNDAPALKSANIGIAMGYGTDVAKDTASIIISDNNFASITAGIEEGRFTYSNLRKIIYLLISTGAAELLMIALSLIFRLPLPFLAVQLLWLNLVTNGIQDVALAFEPGEKRVMQLPPRKPSESVFDPLMIQQTIVSACVISVLVFGLWYHLLNQLHWEESKARNTILLLMVLLQNFHVLNCRSEKNSIFKMSLRKNMVLTVGILIAQGLHILSMQIPFMQNLLGLQPVAWYDWLKLLATASIILMAMEVFKWVKSRNSP